VKEKGGAPQRHHQLAPVITSEMFETGEFQRRCFGAVDSTTNHESITLPQHPATLSSKYHRFTAGNVHTSLGPQ